LRRLQLTGQVFGLFRVVGEAERSRNRRRWLCECSCGERRVVDQGNLRSGHSTSCGCLGPASKTHGLSRTREYRTWQNIISRCGNPRTPFYDIYGGRGIRVCERWLASFDAFLEDLGPRPPSASSIDRINVDGDYEPANCRWADHKTQMRNTRNNRFVVMDGETMTLAEAVERRGLKYNTVLYRLRRGKPVEEALR
jgi:hypothetical protein